MKINQLVFIRDLVVKKRLNKYNANVISIKAGSAIEMTGLDGYDKIDLQEY